MGAIADGRLFAAGNPHVTPSSITPRENRVLIGRGGLCGNVLRISPPMNIGGADVDQFIDRLHASLEQVERV